MAFSGTTGNDFDGNPLKTQEDSQKIRYEKVKSRLPKQDSQGHEEHARIFASYQKAISQLREFYIKEDGLEPILEKTAEIFVKSFGYYMAWYGELQPEQKIIIPKVWAGKYEKYLDGLELELDDSKDAKCAMSLAIVKSKPFGYADLEHDKDFEKWRPLALQYGYRSNQAIPLVIDKSSVGAFLIYSSRPHAFSREIIRYLAGIVNESATIIENITKRRKAAEALRESEEKYRLFFNTAAGLILSVNPGGIILDCNSEIRGTLGYEKDEIVGRSIAKIIHPDYMQQARNCLGEILTKGFARRKEYKMIRKDNKIIDVEINANGLKNKEGQYIGGVCIIQDITDSKEAKETLQKRTRELTVINEMAIELAIVSSKTDIYNIVCENLKNITGAIFTCITSFNPRTQELVIERFITNSILITKAQKILGGKIENIRIPLDPENIQEMLTEKAKKLDGLNELTFGTLQRVVINALTKILKIGDVYGLTLHYGGKLLGTMPIIMPRNKPPLSIEMLKAFANLVSVSLQRAKAEDEHIATLKEKAAIVDAVTDALVILDLDGKIISCNPAFLKMFSFSNASEFIGKHFTEFYQQYNNPARDIPIMKELFKNIVESKLQKNIEIEIRNMDGKELAISASATLQTDADGNPVNVIVVIRDITPERQLQEMEKEAAATRSALETIEGMLGSVLITDLKGTILQANSEFERYTGYKKQEVIGKIASRLGILDEKDDGRIEQEIIPELMKKGFVRNIEMTILRKQGKNIPVLMSWRLIKDAQGKSKNVIATATDITELKNAEEQLREYQKQLQSMASKLSLTEESERRRIATELHDRIVQSLVFTKMKLDKLRSSTLSSIFTKIKLDKFMSSALFFESDEALEEISNMLDKVIEQTQTLTYDLGSPTLYEIGLEAAIEEWLNEEVEQKHNISTTFKISGTSISLSEDISGFLFRSVRELLVNAIKHGKAGHIDVSLHKDKEKIKICIEDDGIGFELSEQGVPKDKRGGYGLFSIKEHLGHFGGSMNIKSRSRHGTTVTLEVPTASENKVKEG